MDVFTLTLLLFNVAAFDAARVFNTATTTKPDFQIKMKNLETEVERLVADMYQQICVPAEQNIFINYVDRLMNDWKQSKLNNPQNGQYCSDEVTEEKVAINRNKLKGICDLCLANEDFLAFMKQYAVQVVNWKSNKSNDDDDDVLQNGFHILDHYHTNYLQYMESSQPKNCLTTYLIGLRFDTVVPLLTNTNCYKYFNVNETHRIDDFELLLNYNETHPINNLVDWSKLKQ